MTDGFVFYRSFAEALKEIPAEQFKDIVMALSDYALDGVEPDNLEAVSKALFTLMKPQIDANAKRREAGRKGGEANAKQIEANQMQNEATPKQTEAKDKVKDKDKEKVKEKVKEKEKEKDIAPEVAVATLDAPAEVKQRMQEFVIMRKSIKKPMTGNAVRLMYGRLQKLSKEPTTQCEILEQSIRHSWQDVYELKDEKPRSGTNKFNNIIQHDWNMDELERKLLGV